MSNVSVFANPEIAKLLQGLAHGAQGLPPVADDIGAPFAPGANPAMSGMPMGQAAMARPMPNTVALPGVEGDVRQMVNPEASPAALANPADGGGAQPTVNGEYLMQAPGPSSPVPGPYNPSAGMPGAVNAASMFGLAPAPPSLREQGDALAQQGYDTPNPAPRSAAYRTPDLLAALPALLMGGQGATYLANLLGAKQGEAQEQNAYQQGEAERQRGGLFNQANQFYRRADDQDALANKTEIARINADGRYSLQGLKNDGALGVATVRGKFAQSSAQVRADAVKDVARMASEDRRLGTLVKQATGNVPEERAIALRGLRDEYPELYGDTTDDQIRASARLISKETESLARAAEHNAKVIDLQKHAGYLGALADQVTKMTPAKIEEKRAAAVKLRAEGRNALARIGLAQAQIGLIQQKTDNYMNEYRLKYATVQGRLAKLGQKSDFSSSDLSAAKNLFNSQATIARGQISRILKMTENEAPDKDSPHYQAYQQAVSDEQEAIDNLKGLNSYAGGMSPTTAGHGGGPSTNPMQGALQTMAAASPPDPNSIRYVGGNANLTVRTPNGVRRVDQIIAEANAHIARHEITKAEAIEILRRAGVTTK